MRAPAASVREGRLIRVRGLVQGVGFRPHVWQLAQRFAIAGSVCNDGAGVEIHAFGTSHGLDAFTAAIAGEAPPLARIESIAAVPLDEAENASGFTIAASRRTDISTGVVPDAATCPACLAEIFDPADRRHGYAFTNCTHCGPRLSIVNAIPYDRATTSMARFPMCEDCRAEYDNPADRRFHAQPNACPVCGPRVWLEDADGAVACGDPLAEAARRIAQGHILAIRGIGGFHLACDASNESAVALLRERKRRPAKPLAVMMRDLDSVRRHCSVSDGDTALLLSPAAPIVLLAANGAPLAPSIAPGQDRVGIMLPYTPLHHLLMARLDAPMVLTSGNLSDEPQATGNADARRRLARLADAFVMHDRDIVSRLDDSVMRLDAPGPQILRRARGFAPAPLPAPLPAAHDTVLAMGGELKSTFCLLQRGRAILSQHLGDLEDAETLADYRKALALYRDIFRVTPQRIAVDLHPDYFSTRIGEELAGGHGLHIVRVQHHHAHLAACLADNAIAPGGDRVLAIVLDGLGLGTDGTIWGGEILAGDYTGFARMAHFAPVALPGGARCMREPWRNTLAHLRAAFGADWRETAGDALPDALRTPAAVRVERLIDGNVNAPLSSSAGRLFDAVAGLLGAGPQQQSFEGQAAMEMETLARPFLAGARPYDFDAAGDVLAWRPLWRGLLDDLAKGAERGLVAARFHVTLAAHLRAVAVRIAARGNHGSIALSGGVMQNRILFEALAEGLRNDGLCVLVHRNVPANDGGLALGQAMVAALSA